MKKKLKYKRILGIIYNLHIIGFVKGKKETRGLNKYLKKLLG